MAEIMTIIGVWIGVFLTFSIFSFLYRDNPFYRFAEQVFVGLSAAYGFIYIIYNVLIPNLFTPVLSDMSQNWLLIIPGILGILMLVRIYPPAEWISRYPLAVVIGTSAGISLMFYLKSDFMNQIAATMINPFAIPSASAISGSFLIILGTICGVYFFYFSKKQEGLFTIPSKIGIWFLMISFGASFGYTVMARISLLIGRIEFLLRDWLHIIK